MNRFLVVSVCITVVLCVSAQQSFTGTWHWSSKSSDFSLVLKQVRNSISGYHCSVSANGTKIDCPDSKKTTLKGIVYGNDSINVYFRSVFSNLKGAATIKFIDKNRIEWRITTKPKGEFYLPTQAILIKY